MDRRRSSTTQVAIAPRRTSSISLPPLESIVPRYHRIQLPGLVPRHQVDFQNQEQDVYLEGLLLTQYNINGTIFTMQKPLNEEENSFSRQTIDGRTLTYHLQVIQQPARARACGAGPRSSADRRPVDPPPVVECHIIETNQHGVEKDVTMKYDAGFMLHASLETARPIAGGQRFNPNMAPVLTGVPVAGTNYLDRPTPAAYFIFSDLSVRHEGWFRLRFSLFEKIKNPEDADMGHPLTSPAMAQTYGDEPRRASVNGGMTNRMEVTSKPFQVYSAKKFPGLTQSTALSRLVADQGCRVRIRRDVRQRKRTGKDDGDGFEIDGISYPATPETGLPPQTPIERARSVSHSDFGGSQTTDHYRRQSMESSRATHLQPRLPAMESPTAPVPSAYPPAPIAPAAAALLDLSQGTSHQQSSMAPPPINAPSHFQRPSMDSGPYTPTSGRQVPEQGYYQSAVPGHPIPVQADPFIRPITQQRVDRANPNIVYDPTIAGYNNATRQYNIPETTARKRSHSPSVSEQSLRNGQRPDTVHLPPAGPAATFASLSRTEIGAIIADDDDNDSDDFIHGEFSYKRADGSLGQKDVVAMTALQGSRRPLRV